MCVYYYCFSPSPLSPSPSLTTTGKRQAIKLDWCIHNNNFIINFVKGGMGGESTFENGYMFYSVLAVEEMDVLDN